MFTDELQARGWSEVAKDWEYAKGTWSLCFDTGHWMIVATSDNPRVFTVPAPTGHESAWTANLIEHLCRMEDERQRLRHALEDIDKVARADGQVRSLAQGALRQCYHSWLVNVKVADGQMGRLYCSVCGKQETSERASGR